MQQLDLFIEFDRFVDTFCFSDKQQLNTNFCFRKAIATTQLRMTFVVVRANVQDSQMPNRVTALSLVVAVVESIFLKLFLSLLIEIKNCIRCSWTGNSCGCVKSCLDMRYKSTINHSFSHKLKDIL